MRVPTRSQTLARFSDRKPERSRTPSVQLFRRFSGGGGVGWFLVAVDKYMGPCKVHYSEPLETPKQYTKMSQRAWNRSICPSV